MPKPKAVVFDLGKVLLDFEFGRAARGMLPHCLIGEAELTAAMNQSELLFQYETGLITTNEFFERMRIVSKFNRDLAHFELLFGDIFTPIPEMIELNEHLRARKLATYIFSNTNELAVKHIRATYPFFSQFDGYIYSYEHRSMKPDPKIYGVVEKTSGRRAEEILYIDDRAENIAHGAERGWQVIHHTSPATTIPRVHALTG